MKEKILFKNDMNYINQYYKIKIYGFIPDFYKGAFLSINSKTPAEPFCITNDKCFGLTYLPIVESPATSIRKNLFVKSDLEPTNLSDNTSMQNALLWDAQSQWYDAKDGEEVSVHYATLQEIKELRGLVESDQVKLSSHYKIEAIELIDQYEKTYPDLIKLMGEEDDII
ncbi:hypothetical protein [Rickettsia endosymbiont of Halotydeus destructor]|uniref:hypothetical protein n=1 Tax=Rickettsia endosymbiont of Halotydeus destructor TaxID=2996754 RepID=UPI003BAFB400